MMWPGNFDVFPSGFKMPTKNVNHFGTVSIIFRLIFLYASFFSLRL